MESDNYKVRIMKAPLIILLVTLLLVLPVLADNDECSYINEPGDVPCQFITTWDYGGNCSADSVKIWDDDDNLLSTRSFELKDATGRCNISFNYTEAGSYLLNTSEGESATIIVKDLNNRFYLYVIAFIIFFTLLGMGLWLEDPVLVSISGMLSCIAALDIFNNGFPQLTNVFLQQSIIIILAGIGFYLIIIPWLDEILVAFGDKVDDR